MSEDHRADIEAAVALVLAHGGLSTGHAESAQELVAELLWQYDEARKK